MAQNWERVLGKVEAKLSKCKWLLAQLSYRGRVLIISNLVASSLWHRLKVQHHNINVVIISIDFLSETTFSSASRRSGVIKAGAVKVGRLAVTPAKRLAKVTGVLSTQVLQNLVSEVWQTLLAPLRAVAQD